MGLSFAAPPSPRRGTAADSDSESAALPDDGWNRCHSAATVGVNLACTSAEAQLNGAAGGMGFGRDGWALFNGRLRGADNSRKPRSEHWQKLSFIESDVVDGLSGSLVLVRAASRRAAVLASVLMNCRGCFRWLR
jgi:hypothetical protein